MDRPQERMKEKPNFKKYVWIEVARISHSQLICHRSIAGYDFLFTFHRICVSCIGFNIFRVIFATRNFSYPTYIKAPHWDAHWNFVNIFGIRKLESLRYHKALTCLVTFCVSRRRRKMYCGHARLCVCVCVCLCVCICPRPYAHITASTRM